MVGRQLGKIYRKVLAENKKKQQKCGVIYTCMPEWLQTTEIRLG